MAKGSDKSDKGDPVQKARRKLAKAQMELSVAEEEHAQARVRGKQEIEQARLRAAKWLTKTGKRVDRRASAVAKAEERLSSMLAAEIAAPVPGVEEPADPPENGSVPLRGREQHALEALRSSYGEDGATATEWYAATGMSEATFLRARKELTDRGLVVRNGDARRGARYVVKPQEAAGQSS
ncbi:MAG TPA: hypothetical protein VF221_02830 [Chloroflexota bacterium]